MKEDFVSPDVALIAHCYAIKVLNSLLTDDSIVVHRALVLSALDKELVWKYCLMYMDKVDGVVLDVGDD